MHFVDLGAQQRVVRAQLEAAVRRVFDHGKFILGQEVEDLERALAEFVGVAHCISCANGTDALQIALMALGIGAGDQVIVPAFSFIATAEAVALLGAEPVFADVLPGTYLIDPDAIAAAISPRTRAVIPVSIFGQCPDFDRITAIAARARIAVIEDAAQSYGAKQRDRFSCSIADIGCTSFFPSKPLGCYGDGGAIFTHDPELAARLRKTARHGQAQRYEHDVLGVNSRLDTIQAAILLVKLGIFERELQQRQGVAACYSELLEGQGLTPPIIAPGNRCVFAQYTIEVDQRAAVRQRLEAMGIPTAVHYPRALHQQPVFRQTNVSAPVAERACERVMSLPMHPYLPRDDCERIVDSLAGAIRDLECL